MSEFKKKTMNDQAQNTLQASGPDTGKAKAAPVTEKKREFVSKGEQAHQWGSYLSIDVVLNAISGVAFAYWGNYTKTGQKLWREPVTKASTAILKPFIKNEASLLESVKNVRGFASIIAGGMIFTVPPLMILENKNIKKAITKKIDQHIYGKDATDNDPKFQKAYDEIEHAPKKGFVVGNVARYAALAPLLASVMIPGPRELTNEHFLKPVGNALEKLALKLGATPERIFKKLPAAERQARWTFLRENAAMDVGFELPYAALHYAFYNAFANMAAHHKTKKTSRHEVEAIAPLAGNVVHEVEKDERAAAAVNKIESRPSGFASRELPPASYTDRAQAPSTKELGVGR